MPKQEQEATNNFAPKPHEEDPNQLADEALGEYEIVRLKRIRENQATLRTIMTSRPNHNKTRPHLPQQSANSEQEKYFPQQSTNNCRVHTIIRILTTHSPHLLEKFSTTFIETNSTAIRAWLISRITTPSSTRQAWDETLLKFLRTGSPAQWFKTSASKKVARHRTNAATSSLLPDHYLSGDAILFPPMGQYVFDTLLSQLTGTARANRLWNALWRGSRKKSEKRLTTIIQPINKNNHRWYIAILHVGTTQCALEICTDVNIRNYAAEQILTEVGDRYISRLKSLESPISQADKATIKAVSPQSQKGDPTRTPTRKPKHPNIPPIHTPMGYQVMPIPRDGHCLYLACIEAMAHNRLKLPPTWLLTPRKDPTQEDAHGSAQYMRERISYRPEILNHARWSLCKI